MTTAPPGTPDHGGVHLSPLGRRDGAPISVSEPTDWTDSSESTCHSTASTADPSGSCSLCAAGSCCSTMSSSSTDVSDPGLLSASHWRQLPTTCQRNHELVPICPSTPVHINIHAQLQIYNIPSMPVAIWENQECPDIKNSK